MKKERRINEEINTNEEALADTVQERDGDKAQEDKTKKKKSGSASTVILVLIMLIGLGVFLYPAVSDYISGWYGDFALSFCQRLVEFHACLKSNRGLCGCGG